MKPMKPNSLLKVIVEVRVVVLLAAGFWFVLQVRPQSGGNLLASTQAYPAPEKVGLTATPGQKQAVQPYPAPSQVLTPEPTKATKPPACKFPDPASAPKQILQPIDRYQFSEPEIVLTSKTAIGIASWLPDGKRLLITRSVGNGRETIETLDIRTGETLVYAEREGAAGKPVWIDDLNAVAFATSVKDRQELWISYGKTNERDIIAADVTGWSLTNDRDRVVYFSPSIGDIPLILTAGCNLIPLYLINSTRRIGIGLAMFEIIPLITVTLQVIWLMKELGVFVIRIVGIELGKIIFFPWYFEDRAKMVIGTRMIGLIILTKEIIYGEIQHIGKILIRKQDGISLQCIQRDWHPIIRMPKKVISLKISPWFLQGFRELSLGLRPRGMLGEVQKIYHS